MEAVNERSSQGVQKPLAGGDKIVPRQLTNLSWGHWEGLDTSGSENKTRLVAGGPPWWWAASLANSPALGGRPQQRRMPCLAVIRAGLEMTSGDNLLPVPNLDGEGVWSMVQHQVQFIIGPLQGWYASAVVHSDQEVCWKLVQQLLA